MVNSSVLEKDVMTLFRKIKKLKKSDTKDSYLLENTYFLDDGRVLCEDRTFGVSRFPYGTDGFTLWAYSSGHISINESTFYVVLPSEEGKEPYLAFFAGELKDNLYVPISLLGRAKNPLESNVERYCVYAKDCVYYLTKTKKCIYAVRAFVTDDKKVSFSIFAKNNSKKTTDIYLSSYLNCLFKYCNGESMETKWFKKCTYDNETFSFESPEDLDRKTHVLNFGVVKRELINEPNEIHNTTSRSVYMGNKENQLVNSVPLREGHFRREKLVTHFTDTAIAGDILKYSLKSNEIVEVNYVISFSHSEKENLCQKDSLVSFKDIEKLLSIKRKQIAVKENAKSMLKINFANWNTNKINAKVLNKFLDYVIYQTEYCGLAKNSGALFLGVRDVMQQIEAALIWNPKDCRAKILEVLSFIDSSGNPPRQYSIPPKGSNPRMDLRDFIDQGVWIINTLYAYLAYTKDYKILDEVIGYYDRREGGYAVLSSRRDTVLDHLIQVMDYLIKHIDPKTKCLRAMYGDWNDALDGLGISSDENKLYGDGVSVMASLQLYANLKEMMEILENTNKHLELVDIYKKVRDELRSGLKDYAIVEKDGLKRIIHGWGENRSYLVGSFCDSDGKSRNSCTANAYYVISDLYKEGYISKEDILEAYKNLDSKYGIKTFEPYFATDCPGVGRIVRLPIGTAENGATYIHGALFAVLSLFYLDEEELAFEQLEKLLPLTHKSLTTTPFVMPNSYSYNEEADMDGESMSDWYTGSANTLIKILVKGLFGVRVSLNAIEIKLRKNYPAQNCSMSFMAQKHYITINYRNDNNQLRRVRINGKDMENITVVIDKNFEGIKDINIEIID
ncbi:MAG: hypothetical protein J1F31_02085 [Erysipelotrichales bacterium]|nr:hypothetical protein [Erysipelotrichales bacterium]